jgi:hypothetical protein
MLAIPAIHVAILVCAEALVRQDPRFVWFVGLAIVAEIAAAIILIARQNANFQHWLRNAAGSLKQKQVRNLRRAPVPACRRSPRNNVR